MRCRRTLFWLTSLVFALIMPLSANEGEVARPTPAQIRQWIEDLNHDDYSTRENAAAQLTTAGPAAINPLAQGIVSGNPEVAWRCGEVLEHIALEGDEPTVERIVHVLSELAKRGKPGLAQLASELRSRQQTFRRERAVAELRKFGGQIGGSYEDALPGAVAIEAVDLGGGVIMEVDLAPAGIAMEDPFGEPSPEDIALGDPFAGKPVDDLEAKLPGLKRFLGRLDDGEPLEADNAAPRLVTRAADALLPGRIGRALRNAVGEVASDTGHAVAQWMAPSEGWPFDPPLNPIYEGRDLLALEELALGFRLPALDEADEEVFDALAATEIFPGEEMAAGAEAVEMAEVDFDVVVAPPLFVAGMMPVAGEMPPGVLWLNAEWRGGDEGLKFAHDLHDVTTLQIENADVTDAALPHVAKMPALRYLQIHGGKFSREALRAFHRERPSVAVMAVGDGMMGVNGNHSADQCTLDMVSPGTGAHQAGLQAGDEVIAIDDDEIRDFSELTISVATHQPGDRLRVVYLRDGEKRETVVTLKARNAGQ
jgi:hypothetical protein